MVTDYLFETKTGLICFVVVQEEMKGVDALLAGLAESTANAIRGLEEQHRRIMAGDAIIHEDFGDITQDVLDGIGECLLPDAHYVKGPLSTVASSLIIFAFFERAMRVIAEGVVSDTSALHGFVKKNSGMGKVRAYMTFLRQEAALEFEIPPDVKNMLEQERYLRNCFAHGEWDIAQKQPRDNFVIDSLAAMKSLFETLEDAL